MREQLERYQVWLYLVAILAGMAIGWMSPEQTRHWEALLWPALGVLLYTTFTQVPLIHLRSAFRDRRFLAALLTGNFILIPVVVGLLLWLLPDDPAIRLGVRGARARVQRTGSRADRDPSSELTDIHMVERG